MRNIFSFFDRKSQKWPKNSQNGQKMTKRENFRPKFLKFFIFRIDSECLKTYSKPKKSISKNFFLWKFFPGTLPLFDQNGHLVKIFDQNFWIFFFRNDSECFKTYTKPKKLISKNFPVENFFSGTLPFFDEIGNIVKIFDQNFWNFFFSESIQNVSKRILNRKSCFQKYFPLKIFLWDSTVFSKMAT